MLPDSSPTSRQRIAGLDAIRFVAACAVSSQFSGIPFLNVKVQTTITP
jgi:hypothetical protein